MDKVLEQSAVLENESLVHPAPTIVPGSSQTWQQRLFSLLWPFAFMACLLPLLNLWYTIATTGANNISNDYLLFLPTLDHILSGTYNWQHFITDTMYMGHWSSLSVLVHVFIAFVSRWDARFELYLGSFFALLRLALLVSLFSEFFLPRTKLLIAGGLAALVFSMSQSVNFLYGQNAIAVNLCLLGFTIGLWGLAKMKKPWHGISIMAIGGLMSSASFGNVLPCWLSFLIAMPIFRYRRWQYYCAWCTATALGLYPYINFLLSSTRSSFSTVSSPFLHKVLFAINMLGRPFCTNIGFESGRLPMSEFAAVAGLLIASLSVWAIITKRIFNCRTKASLVLIGYGLLSVCVVSTVRFLVIPLYTGLSINFWIGIFGLAISLVKESIERTNSPWGTKYGALGSSTLLLIVVLYLITNRTYADKTVYPLYRAPASEAAIRNYRTAPTYAEECVFLFGVGNGPYLMYISEPLERLGLSAFAPNQQWSLQGDFLLPSTTVSTANRQASISWIQGRDPRKRHSWRSYRHLNLSMPSSSEVQWEFDLPDTLESAQLITSLSSVSDLSSEEPKEPPRFSFTIRVSPKGSLTNQLTRGSAQGTIQEISLTNKENWTPFSIDLSKFKGKHVALIFAFSGSNQFGILQYPHINVQNSPVARNRQAVTVTPSNTELSPYFPNAISKSFDFPGMPSKDWTNGEIVVTPDATQTNPYQSSMATMTYCPKAEIDLRDYSHWYVEMSTQSGIYPRVLRVKLTLRDGSIKSFVIPLLMDGSVHKYTYDMKLLDLYKEALLKEITVFPVANDSIAHKGAVSVKKLKLITVL
jgi:hypothetical protein